MLNLLFLASVISHKLPEVASLALAGLINSLLPYLSLWQLVSWNKCIWPLSLSFPSHPAFKVTVDPQYLREMDKLPIFSSFGAPWLTSEEEGGLPPSCLPVVCACANGCGLFSPQFSKTTRVLIDRGFRESPLI